MRLEVRACRDSDLQAITDLEAWAILHTVAHFGRQPTPLQATQSAFASRGIHPWLVAEVDDRFAGFARSTPWKNRESYCHTCELGVYIVPEHQGQGIGRALYEALFSELKRLEFHTVLAGITLPNEASVRLHESFGMTQVALLPEVGFKFDEWHSVGYWARTLD